jgi:hypothetical protein
VSYARVVPFRVSRNRRMPRLTPRHSHGVHLERAPERCGRFLFRARSTLRCVAGRLAFPASSLALPPTRLAPGGGGPSRASASRRRSTGIAASGSSTHSSAPLRSTFLLPGPAHAGLLSWGRTGSSGCPEHLAPSPLRRLCTFLRRTDARPLPAMSRSSSPLAFGCQSESPVPTAWFLTTSPGFSAQGLAGLLHPAADPGVRHVSRGMAEANRDPRDATTPRRMIPSARSAPVTRSPGPPGVRPRGIRDGGIIADTAEPALCEAGTFEALSVRMVCDGVARFRSGTALSFLGFYLLFEVTPTPWPTDAPRHRREAGGSPTVVTPGEPGIDWRDADIDGPDRRTGLRPP